VLSRALALYRRHFGALVLTCAVALLPANLLATGAVVFGLAALGSGGMAEARTHSQQIQEQQQSRRESPPQRPEDQDLRARQLGREAFEGGSASDRLAVLRDFLPIAYATLIVAGVLLAGLFLAHGAAAALVLELEDGRRAGPGSAWAAAAPRMGALFGTGLLGAALVALGALFFVLPGLILAAGFSLAAPLVVREGVAGRAALESSWRLVSGHWGPVILMWVLIVAFSLIASGLSALLPPGPWRLLASALIRVVLYPLPIAGLILVYRDARPALVASR
jgi:hypothetical protein